MNEKEESNSLLPVSLETILEAHTIATGKDLLYIWKLLIKEVGLKLNEQHYDEDVCNNILKIENINSKVIYDEIRNYFNEYFLDKRTKGCVIKKSKINYSNTWLTTFKKYLNSKYGTPVKTYTIESFKDETLVTDIIANWNKKQLAEAKEYEILLKEKCDYANTFSSKSKINS
jgi:hypothetical protein